MRGHLPVAVLVAGLALHLGSGAAQADCGAKNEFEDVYCYAKQYIASDDALNAAYKTLTGKVDADAKAVLKKGQLAWIKKRNAECGSTDSDGYSVDLSCAVDFTDTRTKFLQDRQAECEAGQCDLTKLAEVE
ncbi:lysozyme inhibitor LprI family protein [Dongia sedimenti]|uniref:Lysozyme inhibitor LprI family protein n=1 Tax=Dongia sedimenti TaxID=3064282 RepID=A0ABU0YRA1_9PROT|nr:lysozyme inhibitor LprI family protein [Rhodospirillaceae bacterium R-7]